MSVRSKLPSAVVLILCCSILNAVGYNTSAGETVDEPDTANGKVPKLVITRVPEYLYVRTKGLVPIQLKVVNLGDKVTFLKLRVNFYVESNLCCVEPIVPRTGVWVGTRLTKYGDDNTNSRGRKGFGPKGNGEGSQYIAWVSQKELAGRVGILAAKNGITNDGVYFTAEAVAYGEGTGAYGLTSTAVKLEDGRLSNEVRALGDKTVNVVNISYPKRTGKPDVWGIDVETGTETKQNERALYESQISIKRLDKKEDGSITPQDPSEDDWGYFNRQRCNAGRIFQADDGNTKGYGSVSLATTGTWFGGERRLNAQSVNGVAGTYYGVSYLVDFVEGCDNKLGMFVDGTDASETESGRSLQVFNDASIRTTIYDAYDVEIDPIPVVVGAFKIAGCLIAAPTATNPAFFISLVTHGVGGAKSVLSGFHAATVGTGVVSIKGERLRRLPWQSEEEATVDGVGEPQQAQYYGSQESGTRQFLLNDGNISIVVGETAVYYFNINASCSLKPTFFRAWCDAEVYFEAKKPNAYLY